MNTSPHADTPPARIPKPKPRILPETRVFWEAARRHELVIQQCADCGQRMHFPRFLCHRCLSENLTYVPSSGRGTVYSFTVVRQAAHPAFEAEVPYVYALIELEEGVRMMSNLINISPEEVRIGQPVRVVFTDIGDDTALPCFEPLETPA